MSAVILATASELGDFAIQIWSRSISLEKPNVRTSRDGVRTVESSPHREKLLHCVDCAAVGALALGVLIFEAFINIECPVVGKRLGSYRPVLVDLVHAREPPDGFPHGLSLAC